MRTTIPTLCLFLLLPCAIAHAGEKTVETWDRSHFSGSPSGFVHTVTKWVDVDGESRIETHAVSDMKIKRMGTIIEITSSTVAWEKPDGTLLRIESTSKQSAQERKSIFSFNNGKLTVETTNMGKTRKTEIEIEKGLKGPHFIDLETRKLAGTTGQSITAKTFIADFQLATTVTVTSKGLESAKMHDGSSAELTRVDTAFDKLPAMKPNTWLDAKGAARKTSLKMMGMVMETFRVGSKAEAIAEGEPEKDAPDAFVQSLIAESDPIPVPRRLEKAWVTISPRNDDAVMPTVEAHGYVAVKNGKALEIVAERTTPPVGRQGIRPLVQVPDDLRDSLAPSSMIQSDAEQIIKIANEIVADETNAWVAAQKIERWVFENMTAKNFNVTFGSALEACESREGDCTEHAVLLAALCRAAGIPSRVVMGVVYLYGIWGGHAWNDVWIDGTWYQLDGTNGYGYVDPMHIPMVQMTMKEGGSSEFISLMGSLGNIDIDTTRVVRDGRTISVNDAALVSAEQGRYRNTAWGLQFDTPEGFALRLPRKRAGMSARMANVLGKTDDGKTIQIRIDAMDLRGGTIEGGMRELKWDAAEAATVDGRPARTKTESRKGRQFVMTMVVSDGALYMFSLNRAGSEAGRKALNALLDSVDFDVR